MNNTKRTIVAIFLIVIIAIGWYVALFGIGDYKPIKDQIKLGLDIEGGVYVVMEAQTDLEGEELSDLMNRTKAVMENRVDQMGLTNPVVTVEAGNRIRVELPGVEDAEEAIATIGQTAQLQFALADGTIVLDGSDVKDAGISQDTESGGYAVDIDFNDDGAVAFEEATATAFSGGVGSAIEGVSPRAILILLDGTIVSAPEVNEVISGGSCQITGQFSQEEAVNLAALIRGGALPVDLVEVETSVQTAKIGFDAFEKSVLAGLIGVGFIFLIMIFGYRIMGVAASIALSLYILIIMYAMVFMNSVLTLPGIAGIILSIGMAVDANIIIFARLREEIENGRSIRVATETGFKRAMRTVMDAQITTLIAAIILYQVGTSSVKGFAWTLMIGIFASIFTAVIVTQIFLGVFANSKALSKNSFYGINKEGKANFSFRKSLNFIGKRKIYYMISIIVIAVGCIFVGAKGFNYGIDFTGGTMIHLDMGKQVEIEAIENILQEESIESEIIYSGEKREEIIIKTVTALENEDRALLIDNISKEFNLEDDAVLSASLFGPSIGEELRNNAMLAILIAAIGMFVYIRIRFREWRFGVAAIIGVVHDVLLVVAFYAIFQLTINNPFIAGVLTVVGYSINDTIVVFDRIRENAKYSKNPELTGLIDTSITQTLGRSIMTSLTTLVIMIPLYFMTSEAIREFTLPLMVGVIVGCLSSIFVSSPIYYEISKFAKKTRYQSVVTKEKKKRKNKNNK